MSAYSDFRQEENDHYIGITNDKDYIIILEGLVKRLLRQNSDYEIEIKELQQKVDESW